MAPELQLDDLDNKIALAFPGRFVRKDLVKKLKVGLSSISRFMFWNIYSGNTVQQRMRTRSLKGLNW